MRKYAKYCIPSLCAIGIMLVIFAIKGIIPFGNISACQGDNAIGGISEQIYWMNILQRKRKSFL